MQEVPFHLAVGKTSKATVPNIQLLHIDWWHTAKQLMAQGAATVTWRYLVPSIKSPLIT